MLIGIISDTHGYLHPAVHNDFAGVDLILHAGDAGTVAVIDELATIAPVKGVYGNVDGMDVRQIWPEHERLELEGLQFWMTHIGGRPERYDSRVSAELREDPPDVFICGHSHILRIERDDKLGRMLFINPGAAGRQGLHRVKTCVRLHVESGVVQQAEVIHLDQEQQGL
ncbi:MAG: metallophosphoesterase family protein [Rhodothermales bacterium]|nr:metallophosphoesterase family protein [Rhodothermales bacterium]